MSNNVISTETLVPLDLLRNEIQAGIAETKIKQYPMLNSIRKESAYTTSLDWPVSIGGAETYGRSTSQNPSTSTATDSNFQASLPIGSRVLEHKMTIDLTQATQALMIAPAALRNMYRAKIDAGMDALMKQLEQLIYTGDGTAASHGIVGLDVAMSNVVSGTPSTDIYAGLDGVAYPGWSAFVSTAGSNRALSTALMRATASGQGKLGGTYNLILTTYDLADSMEALFESRLAVNQAGGTTDLGFTGLSYQQRPVKKSVYCPSNNVYFLNTQDVILHSYAIQPAISSITMPGGASEVVNAAGVNILMTRMPQLNPHSVDVILSVQPQLQVFNRHSIAALKKVN
jgi:hypothetical protein